MKNHCYPSFVLSVIEENFGQP